MVWRIKSPRSRKDSPLNDPWPSNVIENKVNIFNHMPGLYRKRFVNLAEATGGLWVRGSLLFALAWECLGGQGFFWCSWGAPGVPLRVVAVYLLDADSQAS